MKHSWIVIFFRIIMETDHTIFLINTCKDFTIFYLKWQSLIEVITKNRISGNYNIQTLCGIVFNLVAFISHRFPKTQFLPYLTKRTLFYIFWEQSQYHSRLPAFPPPWKRTAQDMYCQPKHSFWDSLTKSEVLPCGGRIFLLLGALTAALDLPCLVMTMLKTSEI